MRNSGTVTPEGKGSKRNSNDLFCIAVTMAPVQAHAEDAMQLLGGHQRWREGH
jgi:hypothetical protein